jgi:hypothetical protein
MVNSDCVTRHVLIPLDSRHETYLDILPLYAGILFCINLTDGSAEGGIKHDSLKRQHTCQLREKEEWSKR